MAIWQDLVDNTGFSAGYQSVRRYIAKQPCGRFGGQPAIMLSQFGEQMGAEHHVAVLAAFAVTNMEDHALGIDIGELQTCQFGSPHTGGIERHQNGAVKRIRCGLD